MKWWPSVVSLEIRKILAYRSDFWVTFVGQTLIQLFVARALWQSIFESQHVTQMNGLNLETISLYYLVVSIGNKILIGENIGFISRDIYQGTFTRYLIYPLSVFQYKTLTYLTHSVFYALQLIFITTIYQLFTTQAFSLGHLSHIFLGTALFLFAAFTYCMMATFIELIALWAENIWSLMVLLRFTSSFLGGGLIPLSFFPDWSLQILNLTPFPYLISLPTRTILGSASLEEVIQGGFILLAWGILGRVLVHLIWKLGQKQYTGVGI
ncbi:MAG: ABC transporter permease [Bacteriovoracaceae bacterium]